MKAFKGKTLYVFCITLLLSFAALAASLFNPRFLQPIENLVFDSYQQIKPRQNTNSIVKIIDIDERSIKTLGQWPWPRNKIAELLDKLAQTNVLSIGFDLVFSETDRTNPSQLAKNLPLDTIDRDQIIASLSALPENDDLFAASIEKAPVTLGFFIDNFPQPIEQKIGVSWLGEDLSALLQPINGAVASLPPFQQAAAGHGFITLGEDSLDEIVRNAPMFASKNNNPFPAFSIESLRIAIEQASGERQSYLLKTTYSGTEGGDASAASGNNAAITAGRIGNFEFPLTRNGELIIYYSNYSRTQFVSAVDVMSKDAAWLEKQFNDQIVLIGTSAVGLRDIRKTSLREATPGVFIHAQIIDQIMDGQFLQRPDWAVGFETLLAILLTLIIGLALPITGAVGSAIFGAGCASIVLAISWYAFARYGVLINPAVPMLVSFSAYLFMTAMMYFFSEKEKRFVRGAFQRYLAPNLLAKLEKDPESLKLGGEIRNMTLMFMDVRGFTAISETLPPEKLVTFLNTLLSPLTEIIQKHEGAIDKYIGDSIMAFWNAPLDVADHPKKACLAALEMMQKVNEMNAEDAFGFKELGLGEVGIGIGVNTGLGCVGNMGSVSRFDYSVIGDTVNVAARLESASKEARWPVLISKDTAAHAKNLALLDAGLLELKGKSSELQVFALMGDETIASAPSFTALRVAHQKMLHSKGKTREAAKTECLKLAAAHWVDFINK